ncbi:MAG: PD-(D/E)XK nuclease family protein [Armatimonadetes bacterium]|nr:PD-(D/E)XK nuclease family protein [Armatimonadota bacterium]
MVLQPDGAKWSMTGAAHVIPAIVLKPLASVSPSRFTGLRVCPLREVAVTACGARELLPRYPKARVGSAFHRVCELAAKGVIASEDALQRAWVEEIAAQEGEMQARWYERHLIPLEATTRDYQVLRLQCFAQSRGWLRTRGEGSGASVTLQVEVQVSAPGNEAVGRIDLVRTLPGGIEIVDYKTGIVHQADEGEASTSTVKPEYQDQVRLYAALYFTKYGVWPARLVVVAADGSEHNVSFSPAEAEDLLEQARKLRSSVNSQIASGCAPEALARPSPHACRFCPLRPGCRAYWEARDNSPDWPADVRGRVVELRQLGNGTYRAVLENGDTNVVRGLTPERHHFLSKDCSTAILCNLRQEGMDSQGRRFLQTDLTTGYYAV